MLVYASDAGIEVLRRASIISVDGTFASCPAPFLQVFILMATLPQGSKIPAVFGLLPNKLASTYSHFFRVTKELTEDMFSGKQFIGWLYATLKLTLFCLYLAHALKQLFKKISIYTRSEPVSSTWTAVSTATSPARASWSYGSTAQRLDLRSGNFF